MNATGSDRPKPYGNWDLVLRLVRLSWEFRTGCVKVLALQLALLGLGLSGLSYTGLGIDVIRDKVGAGHHPPRWPLGMSPPDDWPAGRTILVIAALILGFALARALLNYFYTVTANRLVQQQIVVKIRSQVYDKLQRLSFRFYDENASGSIINRVTRDAQATRMFIDGVILQGIVMALSLAVYVAYMARIHAGLALACLATTPLLWLLSGAFSRIVRPLYQRNRELMDELVTTVSESIQGIQVVKGFAREPETTARFTVANDRVYHHSRRIFRAVSTFTPTIGFFSQVNICVLLSYGGCLAIDGRLPLGTGLVVFAGLLQQFSAQVANISNIANSVQESLSGARRVFEVIDAPVEIKSPPNAVMMPRALGSVRFEHVTFGYRRDDPVLHDITFSVEPGQCVAVLGMTGAGKSTLMSLIPRFYDPVSGRVLIDGIDARALDLDDLRRNVGIVFQENFLFSHTIAANIAFGHPGATRQQIERAARIAAAHDFISALPAGYDTVLGEAGADLSGGQRQRLGIARAILLEPAILLLDDPTAAVDPETEHEILMAMGAAMEHRTTFVVAHRLSTLRRADTIVVLDGGRIVQMGTHSTLMATTGPYRGVAMLQAIDDETQRVLGAGEDAGGNQGGNP